MKDSETELNDQNSLVGVFPEWFDDKDDWDRFTRDVDYTYYMTTVDEVLEVNPFSDDSESVYDFIHKLLDEDGG